jgi:hypothetical protein
MIGVAPDENSPMTRKSTIVTLSILGVVAALGTCACCSSGWLDDGQGGPGGGGGHGGHVGRRYFPIFFSGGGASHPAGPSGVGTGTSSTGRGGFGATGSSTGGAHGGGSSSAGT